MPLILTSEPLFFGAVALEVEGLEDGTPYLTIRAFCERCGQVLAERVFDASQGVVAADAAELAGLVDIGRVAEHWLEHP